MVVKYFKIQNKNMSLFLPMVVNSDQELSGYTHLSKYLFVFIMMTEFKLLDKQSL